MYLSDTLQTPAFRQLAGGRVFSPWTVLHVLHPVGKESAA